MTESAINRWRYHLYSAAILIVVGSALLLFDLGPGLTRSKPTDEKVTIGKDYYVTVSLVELYENDPTGARWDNVNESGPDVYVEVLWKGNRIYRSTTKDDTFVAKWSNAELNLRNMAISGSQMSMDDLIRAARINVREGDTVEFRIFDSDLLNNTLAGELSLGAPELSLGDRTYEFQTGGVRRMTVRVSDMNQAVDPLS